MSDPPTEEPEVLEAFYESLVAVVCAATLAFALLVVRKLFEGQR